MTVTLYSPAALRHQLHQQRRDQYKPAQYAGIELHGRYGLVYGMSDNEVPIDMRRPETTGDFVHINKDSMGMVEAMFVWVFPGTLYLTSTLLKKMSKFLDIL